MPGIALTSAKLTGPCSVLSLSASPFLQAGLPAAAGRGRLFMWINHASAAVDECAADLERWNASKRVLLRKCMANQTPRLKIVRGNRPWSPDSAIVPNSPGSTATAHSRLHRSKWDDLAVVGRDRSKLHIKLGLHWKLPYNAAPKANCVWSLTSCIIRSQALATRDFWCRSKRLF